MFRLFRPLSILNHCLKRSYANEHCLPVDPCDPRTNVTIIHNGIRIATEYKPTAVACMSLLVEAGPRYETSYSNGITHLLEHMAYKGFYGMSECDFELSLLRIGAKMTANTTRETQTFTGVFPSECYPTMIDNLAAVVTNLELNSCIIEAEKYNICLEMRDEDLDPRAVTFDYLHQTAFQGTPLSQRVIGPSENVKRFDREFLRQFYCQHYQPYKFTLSTSGAVPHDEIVNLVCTKLGHLHGNPSFESDDGPTRFTGSQIMYRDDSMPFAHVAIAVEAPGYGHPDYWKCLIASKILGNWHKSEGGKYNNASFCARAASVDDAADYFESFYITYRDVGLWGVYFVSKKMDVEDMLINVQHQWKSLCLMTQFTDMQRGMNAAKMQLARDMTGVVNSCHDIGTQMFYKCTRTPFEDKIGMLKDVQLADLSICMEGMIYNKCPAVAAVGPVEGLPEYNRIRDNMYWLRA